MIQELDREVIRSVGQMILRIIDVEESELAGRTAVAERVCARLDKIKYNLRGLPSLLERASDQINRELPDGVRGCVEKCVFYPQMGFFVVVGRNPATGNPYYEGQGLTHPWEPIFITEDHYFFKTNRMIELDEGIGDLQTMATGMFA